MRPDAYLIVAEGQRLYAPTPEELAEIAECANEAGDRIELVRTRDGAVGRPLRGHELERFCERWPLASRERKAVSHRRRLGPGSRAAELREARCPMPGPGRSTPALATRQAEAVLARPGQLLVLAGAGSGKTRVMTERAAAMVANHGQPAGALLVVCPRTAPPTS